MRLGALHWPVAEFVRTRNSDVFRHEAEQVTDASSGKRMYSVAARHVGGFETSHRLCDTPAETTRPLKVTACHLPSNT